jgi:hypothetical protein
MDDFTDPTLSVMQISLNEGGRIYRFMTWYFNTLFLAIMCKKPDGDR